MADSIVNKNTTTALLAGALLGAGIALLLAPQSGRRTRRNIRQFAERAKNKAEAAKLELKRSLENIVGDIAEQIQDRLDSGMDWTDSKITELQQALEATRKFVSEEIDKIQSS
jgi:gas vesicle protein